MSKRIMVSIGDIFEIDLNNKKAYLQFISLDKSQLNSEVVRVFDNKYDTDLKPTLEEIVNDTVQFYTHVVVKDGVKEGIWKKYGNLPLADKFEYPNFRASADFGNPKIKKSTEWYIWQVNKDKEYVGVLNDSQKNFDYGEVFPPFVVLDQIKNGGKYPYIYPSY